MPLKLHHSPNAGCQTATDAPIHFGDGISRSLCIMKALSESYRVLEYLVVQAHSSSQALPLSTDQKLSIFFLVLFLTYCFLVYPSFICPTGDIPGTYITSTALGYLPHFYHKHHDNADQWTLSLHKTYGSVVRLSPTFVSVNDAALLPNKRRPESLAASRTVAVASNGSSVSASRITSAKSPDPNAVQSPTASSAEHPLEPQLFETIIRGVMTDLRTAMKGQKTVDIHALLSRHLQHQTPPSFAKYMSHTIYQLAHPLHRHYFKRLRRELCSLDQGTDKAQIQTLQLLGGVVKEILRLQQAPADDVPFFVVYKAGFRIGDCELEIGTEVLASRYCLCRNEDIFEDPDEFQPDRWLENPKRSLCHRQRMQGALDFALDHQRATYSESDVLDFKVLLFAIIWGLDMRLPVGEQSLQLSDGELGNGKCLVRFRERKMGVKKRVRFVEHVVM